MSRIEKILQRLDECADSKYTYFEISPETSRELRDWIKQLRHAYEVELSSNRPKGDSVSRPKEKT